MLLQDPDYVPPEQQSPEQRRAVPLTRNRANFTRAIRRAVFDFVRDLSRGHWEAAIGKVQGEWTANHLARRMDDYWEAHGLIRLDPEARNTKQVRIDEIAGRRAWRVEQILVDTEKLNDWSLVFTVDLDRCDAEMKVVLTLEEVAAFGE